MLALRFPKITFHKQALVWALTLKHRRSVSSSSLSMVPKKDPKSSHMDQSPLSQLPTGNSSPGDFLEMSA